MPTPALVIPTRRPSRPREVSAAVLRQISPPGAAVSFGLDPQAVTPSGGVGGWAEVAHPKRASSVEWEGQPLRQLELDLVLDGPVRGDDVENVCRILDVWGRPQAGQREPAVLAFEWARYGSLRWVVNGLSHGDAIRKADGTRTRQELTVTLLEHREAEVGLRPAQRAAPVEALPASKPGKPSSGKAPAPSGRVYTVRSGDTLSRIAQQQLGKAARWPELARLNNLRDPNRLTVGQRLRLPA